MLHLQILETLLAGTSLTEEQTQHALDALVEGAHQTQMAAFLVLLRAKVLPCPAFPAPFSTHG